MPSIGHPARISEVLPFSIMTDAGERTGTTGGVPGGDL
jgi:hypothetical protein